MLCGTQMSITVLNFYLVVTGADAVVFVRLIEVLTEIMNHHMLISDVRVSRVLHMLQDLTMIPRIVIRRVDETFPSLRHSTVSNAMLFFMFCWGR